MRGWAFTGFERFFPKESMRYLHIMENARKPRRHKGLSAFGKKRHLRGLHDNPAGG